MPAPLGDPLARRAEELLVINTPYPGDDISDGETFSAGQFTIYQTSETHHVIMDEEDLLVPSSHLQNPLFCLGDWYTMHKAGPIGMPKELSWLRHTQQRMGNAILDQVCKLLNEEQGFPGGNSPNRFSVARNVVDEEVIFEIRDSEFSFVIWANDAFLHNERLDVTGWYCKRLMKSYRELYTLVFEKELEWEDDHFRLLDRGPLSPMDSALEEVVQQLYAIPDMRFEETGGYFRLIELNGQQVAEGTYPSIQRNVAVTRDFRRMIPKPVVIVVHINGRPARVLIDTGSLANFLSSTLADQLRVKRVTLEKPLTIQLAVQGSRSCVNFGTKVHFEYQKISEGRFFDIINLQNYDLILGTPFLFQHQVLVGFNLPRVVIRSTPALPIKGEQVSTLESWAVDAYEENLDKARQQLHAWAKPLCAKASQMGLPSLHAINHTIPLIDTEKIYKWCPSRCPEPLRPQWGEK
ncbi:hypothetical protein BD769DRAFT_1366511 [Suillus cothurnatus]|nr:hypothetical protein BD769DRAFT_1366511 [Suillus cothurnatus]